MNANLSPVIKRKQKMMDILVWILGIFMILTLIMMTLITVEYFIDMESNKMSVLTSVNCCEGNSCTDIYYEKEENLCHLVICEQIYGVDNEKCIYSGKNKSLKELRYLK